MGTKTKSFVRSLRNKGLKLFLDVQDVSDTVSKDGLCTGTKNDVKQLNASAVRHSLHACHVTYTGVQGQEKGSLAPSSRLAESCTFVCQQSNHKNRKTASLEMFMAQIQSERYSKQQVQGWRALYRENGLRPFLEFITPKRNKASTASPLFAQESSAAGLSNTLIWGVCVIPAVRWQRVVRSFPPVSSAWELQNCVNGNRLSIHPLCPAPIETLPSLNQFKLTFISNGMLQTWRNLL